MNKDFTITVDLKGNQLASLSYRNVCIAKVSFSLRSGTDSGVACIRLPLVGLVTGNATPCLSWSHTIADSTLEITPTPLPNSNSSRTPIRTLITSYSYSSAPLQSVSLSKILLSDCWSLESLYPSLNNSSSFRKLLQPHFHSTLSI